MRDSRFWLKGSYVVEASWVVSISILLIYAGICLCFDVYDESIEYITCSDEKEIDPVELWWILVMGEDVLKGGE